MAEYIEREAAYEDFEKCNGKNPKWTPIRVKTLIARQKAADVAPVRHGRWVFVEQRFYHGGFVNLFRCSECKVATDTGSNYCPNCGAMMDGGSE